MVILTKHLMAAQQGLLVCVVYRPLNQCLCALTRAVALFSALDIRHYFLLVQLNMAVQCHTNHYSLSFCYLLRPINRQINSVILRMNVTL